MLTELLLQTICWVLVPYEEESFKNVFVKLFLRDKSKFFLSLSRGYCDPT